MTVTAHRIERVKDLIQEVTCEIIREIKDPRVGFITVTDVELTPDLKYARIFVSVLGNAEEKKQTMLGLKSATGFVRRELSHRIRMKYIPEISFVFDESIERGSKVLSLLSRVTAGQAPGERE